MRSAAPSGFAHPIACGMVLSSNFGFGEEVKAMFDAGSFNPLIYYSHAVIGFTAAGCALFALGARKGGALHRLSGKAFAATMGFAAVTAIYFFVSGPPAPPIIISALASIYGIGMAILSLKDRRGGWRAVQWGLAVIPILLGLLFVAYIAFAFLVPDIPIYLAVLGPMAGALMLYMGWSDIAFLRDPAPDKNRRIGRHGWRMAFVAAEVVRAPLISFGPQFLGERTFDLYSFGPYLLIPLFYFAARPAWLKEKAANPQMA